MVIILFVCYFHKTAVNRGIFSLQFKILKIVKNFFFHKNLIHHLFEHFQSLPGIIFLFEVDLFVSLIIQDCFLMLRTSLFQHHLGTLFLRIGYVISF